MQGRIPLFFQGGSRFKLIPPKLNYTLYSSITPTNPITPITCQQGVGWVARAEVDAAAFQNSIAILIAVNLVTIGLETDIEWSGWY